MEQNNKGKTIEPISENLEPATLNSYYTAHPQSEVPQHVPSQPLVGSPQYPNPPTPVAATVPAVNPGQTLGIVSIVLSFLGMAIIGLVLGVISRNQSKQAGAPTTLGTVGMVIGIVFSCFTVIFGGLWLLISVVTFNGIQDRATESQLQSNINMVAKKAEAYYVYEEDYPKTLSDFSKHAESELDSYSDFEVTTSTPSGEDIMYRYCGEGAAQLAYVSDYNDDELMIEPLGTADSYELCDPTFDSSLST